MILSWISGFGFSRFYESRKCYSCLPGRILALEAAATVGSCDSPVRFQVARCLKKWFATVRMERASKVRAAARWALSFLFVAWLATEYVLRSQTFYAYGEVGYFFGIYETDRDNCGNRQATEGESLYVGSRGFVMLRGEHGAGEEFAFEEGGVKLGGRHFFRCAVFNIHGAATVQQ